MEHIQKLYFHVQNVRAVCEGLRNSADQDKKKYFTKNKKESIEKEISRIKEHLGATASAWKSSDNSFDDQYSKLEFSLEALLDNISAILSKDLKPSIKVELLEQHLADFEKHLNTLNDLMRNPPSYHPSFPTSAYPPSPSPSPPSPSPSPSPVRKYLVTCKTTGKRKSFDDYAKFVEQIDQWRQEDPGRKLVTEFRTTSLDNCLLTRIGTTPNSVVERVLTKVTLTSSFNTQWELPNCVVDTY